MKNTANVTIMGSSYNIACPEDKLTQLNDAAAMVDSKMQEIKDKGSILIIEKIAVMAALNLASELLDSQKNSSTIDFNMQHRLSVLCAKVEKVLSTA